MTPYEEYLLPIQRRAILSFLVAANGFELNDGLLMSVLRDESLPVGSRENMHAIEDWLAEKGLVTIRTPKLTHTIDRVLCLTDVGMDVALGLTELPGIQRASRETYERLRGIANGTSGA